MPYLSDAKYPRPTSVHPASTRVHASRWRPGISGIAIGPTLNDGSGSTNVSGMDDIFRGMRSRWRGTNGFGKDRGGAAPVGIRWGDAGGARGSHRRNDGTWGTMERGERRKVGNLDGYGIENAPHPERSEGSTPRASPSTLGRPGLRHGSGQLVGFLGLQRNPDVARGLSAGVDRLLDDGDGHHRGVDQNGKTVADMLPG